MGRFFALALETNAIPPKSKSVKQQTSSVLTRGKQRVDKYIFATLAILSILYFMQINNLATKGYEIKILEKRIAELKESQERLDLESASLQSVQRIEESVQNLNLVPSLNVKYPKKNGYAYEDSFFQ